MVKRVRNDISDGVRWRCTTCKTSKSIRDGSFFSKSKLPLQKWLILWWSQDYPVTDAKAAAEVDEGIAVDVYRSLREVCSNKLLGMTITLGGPGVVVQVDESLFRHKPKVHTHLLLLLLVRMTFTISPSVNCDMPHISSEIIKGHDFYNISYNNYASIIMHKRSILPY